jgi:hypothetical protein
MVPLTKQRALSPAKADDKRPRVANSIYLTVSRERLRQRCLKRSINGR